MHPTEAAIPDWSAASAGYSPAEGFKWMPLNARSKSANSKACCSSPTSLRRFSRDLSLPDVHLISLLPEFEGLIVPSKYYGIAAAGRPSIFVGDPEGELAETIRQGGTGFAVREGDGKGLAAAILAMARDPALISVQGENARTQFEAKFDFPHALDAWETIAADLRCTATSKLEQPAVLR